MDWAFRSHLQCGPGASPSLARQRPHPRPLARAPHPPPLGPAECAQQFENDLLDKFTGHIQCTGQADPFLMPSSMLTLQLPALALPALPQFHGIHGNHGPSRPSPLKLPKSTARTTRTVIAQNNKPQSHCHKSLESMESKDSMDSSVAISSTTIHPIPGGHRSHGCSHSWERF